MDVLNQHRQPDSADGARAEAGMTREQWLHRAIEALRPRFAQLGMPLPAKVHVSVGFGSKAESKHVLRQCWARCASADGVNHIFISPVAGDPAGMLATLVHERVRAADDCAHGHRRNGA